MAKLAHEMESLAAQFPDDAGMRVQLLVAAGRTHADVAKYVTPQLKAVDLTSGGQAIGFNMQINLVKETMA